MKLLVWINAFIPKNVPGYTITITRGTHAGKTAVPLPGVARSHPQNAIKDLDCGYLTDQRSFDSSFSASVRMQSWFMLQIKPFFKLIASDHRTSGTTEVDMDTGKELGFANADMTRCHFSGLRPKVRYGNRTYRTFLLGIPYRIGHGTFSNVVELSLKAQAGDPLVAAAADIDYRGVFTISSASAGSKKVAIGFSGFIDDFPAFECYASMDGITKCLFKSSPPKGNTVVDLLGEAKRRVSGFVRF